jgi:hypothetical protein
MAQDTQSNTAFQYTSPIFKSVPPKVSTDVGGLSNFLEPTENGGGIDVVNKFRWTLTDKKGRTETPKAILTEFRVLQSALANSARYYATGIVQQGTDILAAGQAIVGGGTRSGNESAGSEFLGKMRGYAGLLDFSNPTGFRYSFPYFSDVANEVTSTWTSLDILEKVKGAIGVVSPGVADIVQKAADVFMFAQEAKYPRVGVMDRPKLWQESSFRNINIKFPLFNTVDVNDIQKNWDLCYLLLYQNMFNKRDFITAVPPVFYSVDIPGQFFSIGMYVSDLKIYNRGNIRQINVGGKNRNIPDVYEVDMTLTDIIMPSQNMLSVLLDEKPVNVQTQIDPGLSYEQAKETLKEKLLPGTNEETATAAAPASTRAPTRRRNVA